MKTTWYGVKYTTDGKKILEDHIACEVLLSIFVNGNLHAELECSPNDLQELAIGYLFVNDGYEIDQIHVEHPLECEKDCHYKIGFRMDKKLMEKDDADSEKISLQERQFFSPHEMMDFMDILLNYSNDFRKTGCIHSAGFFGVNKRYIGEDISRYYALYKAAGKAVSKKADFAELCLCTTGRLPIGYMKRAIRTGILCIVSRSAPTDQALCLAERNQIQVGGFTQADKMNLYATLTGCAVLAGGEGSRYGNTDKAMLLHHDKSFLRIIMEQFPKRFMKFISYNRAESNLQGNINYAVIVRDRIRNIGPLGGLEAILSEAVKRGCAKVFVVACDMPFFHQDIFNILLENYEESLDALIMKTKDGRLQPLCGLYSIRCLVEIERMIQKKCYKMKQLLERVNTKYLDICEYDVQEQWFSNINTEEDYNNL